MSEIISSGLHRDFALHNVKAAFEKDFLVYEIMITEIISSEISMFACKKNKR